MGLLVSCCCGEVDSNPENEGGSGSDRSGLLDDREVYLPAVSGPVDSDIVVEPNGMAQESVPKVDVASLAEPGSAASTAKVQRPSQDEEKDEAIQQAIDNFTKNIIDLNAVCSPQRNAEEPSHVYPQSVKYSRRLARAAHSILLKHSGSGKESGLCDSSGDHGTKAKLLSSRDALLVTEVARRAQVAYKEFRVEPVDDLVVQFGDFRSAGAIAT